MTDDEWLTVREIAAKLKVHRETVVRWIRADQLPATLMGSNRGGYRIRRADYERFVTTLGRRGKAAA